MLNYGGYAQTYFNEKTDALANKGLYNKTNDPVLTTNTTVSKDYNYDVFNNNMGVSFLGRQSCSEFRYGFEAVL